MYISVLQIFFAIHTILSKLVTIKWINKTWVAIILGKYSHIFSKFAYPKLSFLILFWNHFKPEKSFIFVFSKDANFCHNNLHTTNEKNNNFHIETITPSCRKMSAEASCPKPRSITKENFFQQIIQYTKKYLVESKYILNYH